jgi:hypothetical protein
MQNLTGHANVMSFHSAKVDTIDEVEGLNKEEVRDSDASNSQPLLEAGSENLVITGSQSEERGAETLDADEGSSMVALDEVWNL